jgi:hypothetical protein
MFELQDLWAKARTCAKAASGAGFSAPTRMTRGASTAADRRCSQAPAGPQAGGRASRCGQLGSPSGLLEGGSAMTGLVEHSGREWKVTPLGLERTTTGIGGR